MKNLRFKQISILAFGLLLSTVSLANRYECKASTSNDYVDEKSFSAIINIDTNNDTNKITAKVERLKLSEEWPLSDKCLSPLSSNNRILIGTKGSGGEIKLFPRHDKECGFIYFFTPSKNGSVTLLSPRKTYQIFGESPYLAECRKV